MATDIDISKLDLYDFLGLAQGPSASIKEINRAGRQTSLRYHPDKVEATPENLEKFHTTQVAIGILTDPEQKLQYDQKREAKQRRKAEVDALDERRRKMAQDLEDREKAANSNIAGTKRTFSEREMKIKMIQETNRRKLEERNAQIRTEAEKKLAEERRQATEAEEAQKGEDKNLNGAEQEHGTSIRLRWVREGAGLDLEESSIRGLFPADDIEDVVVLQDKKRKTNGRKVVMGNAVVIFKTRKGANNAMGQKGKLVDQFESIDWVSAAKS